MLLYAILYIFHFEALGDLGFKVEFRFRVNLREEVQGQVRNDLLQGNTT